MKKKLRLERWRSSDNQEEIHFFDGPIYIIGFNPALIDWHTIMILLESFGYSTKHIKR